MDGPAVHNEEPLTALEYMLQKLSELLAFPESGLRLLVGIILGFPSAILFKELSKVNKNEKLKHIYMIFTGITLSWFVFGLETYRNVFGVAASYLLVYFGYIFHQRYYAAILNSIFIFNYFLYCIYISATDGYDILFTTPLSMIVFKMIGFGFDVSDASDPSQKNRLLEFPSILEIFSYNFSYLGYFIGPFFAFKNYRKFVQGTWNSQFELPSEKLVPSGSLLFRKISTALVYFAVAIYMRSVFPTEFLLSVEFKSYSMPYKLFLIFITGKTIILKYFGPWILQDVVGILSGFGVSGIKDGEPIYENMSNVRPFEFETANSLKQLVESYNINTNAWVKYYIFKRLIFLGNKQLSSFLSLLFLAVWHGFHIGYYICFASEFVFAYAENNLINFLYPLSKSDLGEMFYYLYTPLVYFGRLFVLYYSMISFDLLHLEKIITAYSNVSYAGHIVLVFLGISPLLIQLLTPKKTKTK